MQFKETDLNLSEEEATELAENLKAQLQKDEIPISNQKLINQLVAGLGDKRGLLRRTFAESLGKIGKSATPALRNALLKNKNVTVRRSAAKALKLIGDKTALPDLLFALLNDQDPIVQGSSAGAIAIFGEVALKELSKVLTNPKSTSLQCGLASWAFAFVGAEAPEALKKAAKSKNILVRSAAIAALGEQIHSLQDKKAMAILIEALDDPSIEVRIQATILVGQLNQKKWANEFLIKKLFDDSSELRKNAALGLMKTKDINVLKDLKKQAKVEKDQKVLEIITLAIKQITINN